MTLYYVKNGGSDAADGLSDANAWETINKVNISSFNAGDSVLFKKGSTWREQLTVPSSGSAGSPIIFGAYESGNLPIISGADILTGFDEIMTSDEGPDLMTNGTFGDDTGWTLDASWSIGGGVLTHNGGLEFARHKPLTESFVNGKTYKIYYDVSGTSGSDTFAVLANHGPSNNNVNITYTPNGSYTTTWESGKSANLDRLDIASNREFSLDNIIIKEQLTPTGTGVYQKTGVTTEPKVVIYDGVRLTLNDGATSSVGSNEWDWAANTLYVNVGEDPDVGVLEAGQRDATFYIPQRSYITIQDIEIQSANVYANLFVWTNAGTVSNIIVNGITSKFSGVHGIQFENAHAVERTTDVIITQSTITEAGGTGIRIGVGVNDVNINHNHVSYCNWQGTSYTAGIRTYGNQTTGSGIVVEHNEVDHIYHNGALWANGNGIHIDEVAGNPGPIVRYNNIHDNEQLGIFVEHVRSGAKVYYNISYNHPNVALEGVGILVYQGCDAVEVYNNVFYGNNVGIGAIGEATGDTFTNNLFKNNISINNTRQLWAQTGGSNDGGRGSGNVYNKNCFGTELANFIRWIADTDYSTYDTWIAASSQTDNNVEADPLFVTPGTDFHLQATSPCIDAGVDVGLTRDYGGNLIISLPDMGAYEYQYGCVPGGGGALIL